MTQPSSAFTPASDPLPANAIRTDTTGLTAGEVQIPTPTGSMPGYRSDRKSVV